jgi:hypothetical protein
MDDGIEEAAVIDNDIPPPEEENQDTCKTSVLQKAHSMDTVS